MDVSLVFMSRLGKNYFSASEFIRAYPYLSVFTRVFEWIKPPGIKGPLLVLVGRAKKDLSLLSRNSPELRGLSRLRPHSGLLETVLSDEREFGVHALAIIMQ